MIKPLELRDLMGSLSPPLCALKKKEGIFSSENYEAGDFVSLDQFIVRTPGRLPTGFGHENSSDFFMEELFSMMQPQELFGWKTK